jgi:HEAT repeat protein
LYAEDQSQRPAVGLIAGKLRQALKDESPEVRVNVAVALSLMEGEGPELVPILEELLHSELPHVRTMAVSALGGLGTLATTAIPAIESFTQTESDPTAKTAALEALSQLRSLR